MRVFCEGAGSGEASPAANAAGHANSTDCDRLVATSPRHYGPGAQDLTFIAVLYLGIVICEACEMPQVIAFVLPQQQLLGFLQVSHQAIRYHG